MPYVILKRKPELQDSLRWPFLQQKATSSEPLLCPLEKGHSLKLDLPYDEESKMSRSHWLLYLCQDIANMVPYSGGAGLSPKVPDGTEYSGINPSAEQLLLRPLRFVLIRRLYPNVFRTLVYGESYPLHYSSGFKTILPALRMGET